jgi:hypothetical protein
MRALLIALAACGEPEVDVVCELPSGADLPPFIGRIGCAGDFAAMASEPPDSSIPGARSVKTVVDRSAGGRLYFQDSRRYPIHWAFASENLSGRGLPIVGTLEEFNDVEYYSPDRRFILGAVTRYEGPNVFAYELSPYDTAGAEMIAASYRAIRDASYFGGELLFHPTSEAVEREAMKLGADVRIVSTDELFAGIDYQPLNLAEAYGRLRFVGAADLETSYLDFREIAVLDHVPNDISVVSGIITAEFQTPLSHINVLSQNRGTPNMALRNAGADPRLVPLDGKWVRLVVGPFEWSIAEVSKEEADAWWEAHRPAKVSVPRLDLSVTAIAGAGEILDRSLPQRERIRAAIPAYGGKASHYAELFAIEGVRVPDAFAIPVYYYQDHLERSGIRAMIEAALADEAFQSDPRIRDVRLRAIRDAIEAAELNPDFVRLLTAKLERDFPGGRMRFRSSTNAEDLEGFTGAGLYTSKTGDPNDPMKPIAAAIKKVWASVWFFRAFEERSYRGIDHLAVGMAILSHRSFPDEYANGVALTANPFDASGLEPGFYINVQRGEASVVMPDRGVTSDELIYQFDRPGQPVIYLERSTLVPPGESVLTGAQLFSLGEALSRIHRHFFESYGPPASDPLRWYGMDVELKFDEPEAGAEPVLFVKQARPHPGRRALP